MKKTVFITGASSGIGKATAKLFAQKGWNVAATMRTPEKENELIKFENVKIFKLDVIDTKSIKTAINEAKRVFGDIDVVVNNAGYGLTGPFEASTMEQIDRQFQTNVFGLMNVTREILPHFRDKEDGVIINVASMGGRITFPLYSLYHASKWAVEGFSESLQHELKPFNIKVKIIEPGPIRTDFYDRSMDVMRKEGLDAYDSYINKAMPNMNASGINGAPPEVVAKTIYKAAVSNNWKLRYPADLNAKLILILRGVLPDRLFNGLIRLIVLK
jgi:short-subunit dehydrogenase